MNNWIKYTTSFLIVFLIRLIPFRAPNIEPVMAVIMPFGKVFGPLASFLFGFLSIFIFDSVTSGIGVWTIITGISYGFLGLGSWYFFRNRFGWKNYAVYAFIGTILYDGLTGLTIGPIFFHQSFMSSLIGQIPFTILHLVGNISFAIVLSSLIEKVFVCEWFLFREKKELIIS